MYQICLFISRNIYKINSKYPHVLQFTLVVVELRIKQLFNRLPLIVTADRSFVFYLLNTGSKSQRL